MNARGVCNALAQAVLKLTAPGVPDTYQGAEDWKFDLVDPDNRRPVPFDALAERLGALDEVRASDDFGPDRVSAWLDTWPDGRIKLHVASALLRARRDRPDLWLRGTYRPLDVDLSVAATAMAFARSHEEAGWALVITGLRTGQLPGTWPVGSAWATSRVILPLDSPSGGWRDLLTGALVTPARTSSEQWMFLAQALQVLPVAVLVPDAG